MTTDQFDRDRERAQLAYEEAKQKMLETRIAAAQAELAFCQANVEYNAAFDRWYDSVLDT